MERVVFFGVGSPVAIDVEESCRRAGIEIVAGVRNVEAPVYVSSAVRVIRPAEISAGDRMCGVALAMFTPAHRQTAFRGALEHAFTQAATIVDSTACVARTARLGEGVYVNAGVVIGGCSVLGDFVFVNRSASIGHHCELGAFASIGPGAIVAGFVKIGRGAMLGTGAVILPEIAIGANAVVGAGAVVTRSVPPQTLVMGNPARIVKSSIGGFGGLSVDDAIGLDAASIAGPGSRS